jgi:hypothetical protein
MAEIEYGMAVLDKNSNSLGNIEKIIMDTWKGEPRKYMARCENETAAFFFAPEQVAAVHDRTVKLNIDRNDLDQTT